jgi:2-haloacid dehalogenase
VTVIVFDIGNVLLRWNPRNLYRKVFQATPQMEWFLANICDTPWNEAQDLGRKWIDAIAERIALFPQWESEIRAYDERWVEMLDGEITENVCLLKQLKSAGMRTFAITNFSTEKLELAKAQFRFFEHFDGMLVSGDVGLIKPDPRIFRLLLERYRLTAANCLFIDDSITNVAVARDLGMKAIHYQESLDLTVALQEHGIDLL